MKCERCQKNPARVRVDEIVNGRRVQHYLCQSCIDELMGAAMEQMGGMDGQGSSENPLPFGFAPNFNNSASAAGGVNTATAERQAKHSKTPTLDQYGRDLTAEAAEGKLDPAAGRQRELRRVITVLGRRQKNNPVLIVHDMINHALRTVDSTTKDEPHEDFLTFMRKQAEKDPHKMSETDMTNHMFINL